MVGQHSFQSHPETRFASGYGKGAGFALHTPRQNHLLAALPTEDYERLLPDLELITLPVGWAVHGAGDRERYLYFLTAGIVSRFYVAENGESAEFAVTGREGVIGVAAFLGGESTPGQAVVVSAGSAYRLGGRRLKSEFEHNSQLSRLLLRYTLALISQIGQIAVCNRHHSIEQQLCRLILLSLDRLPSNEVSITQEMIAEMLGVRREGVTTVAGKLQKAGLIHYSRGHIAVIDRPRLEAQVCECYAVIKREYDCLVSGYRQAEFASSMQPGPERNVVAAINQVGRQ